MTPLDASTVAASLLVDANNYYYSACLSILDGLRAVDSGFYTWSTVKLYYSVFYAIRAILAWRNTAIFWPDQAPFLVSSTAGSIPRWISGKGTHKPLLDCFRQLHSGDPLLSQPVGGATDGLEWLLRKREEANYLVPRFCEPDVPGHYESIVNLGVRRAICEYLEGAPNLLTFDEDHAIAAYPLAVLSAAGTLAAANGGATIGDDELNFFVKKCQERHGAMAPLLAFIRQTLAK